MTNKLKWRLGKMATPDEVLKLVNDKIITKEEARDILFNEEVETERDKESLEQEIKFLREIISKLSYSNKIIEIIKEVQVPYYHYNWVQPYSGWGTINCGSSGISTTLTSTSGTASTTYLASGSNAVNCAFTDIQTF